MTVLHAHAVAGSLSGILTGFFAEPKLSRFFYQVPERKHHVGLAYGIHMERYRAGMKQIGMQLLGIVFVFLMNITTTSPICLLVRSVVPVRLAEEKLQMGHDAIHGEEACILWGDGEKLDTSKYTSVHKVHEFPFDVPKVGGELEMA